MNPFLEITGLKGQQITINLQYVILYKPSGINTEIWVDTCSSDYGAVTYLASIDYESFKRSVIHILGDSNSK
jgi:hypothetical protein